MAEVARLLADAGHKVPTRMLPDWLVHVVGLFDPTVRMVIPQLGSKSTFDTSRIRDELGWRPRPLPESILATADSLKSHGVIK
jgi:nucleoside-diphosphate-sugar epimerase